MHTYQQEFLEFAIAKNVLRFGNFTLKSGRQSPYFFNMGLFNDGQAIAELGRFYAQAIEQAQIEFDLIFGPAYKGIPLVTTTSIALADHHQRNLPYCFNRKEVKDHGEGGNIVGAPLQGRVLLIDDVISAGTAIREAVEIIQAAGAELVGVIIALNRQERGQGKLSAIQEIERQYNIPVTSIVNLDQVTHYLAQKPERAGELAAIKAYRREYGV